MKLKQTSLWVLLFGLVILVVGALAPILYWNNYITHNGAIGIIGGTEAPLTYSFMLSASFDGLPLGLVLIGSCLTVSSGFCLLFPKVVKTHCRIDTSAIAVGLSATGVLGSICVFLWFTMVAFGELSNHPVRYPASILLGVLCFVAFVILAALYFKARKKNWSIKGFAIDVITGIINLPVFFFVFGYLYNLIQN